jgi:uncharacterized protein
MTGSRFVWHELMSNDKEKSLEFFTNLFGWTVEDRDMDGFIYPMLTNKSETFAGAVDLDKSDGLPSHWISYISCDDVDEFCAKATDMGATIGVPPMDIPGVGRFAVVGDVQGAYFTPFKDTSGQEMPELPPAERTVAWNELMTSDPEAAANFYAKMFGWKVQVMDIGTGPYRIMSDGDEMVAGIGQAPQDMPVSAWVIYFQVSDADATLASVTELGGTVLVPAMDIPTVGRIAWATDPAGATFAIMQPEFAG